MLSSKPPRWRGLAFTAFSLTLAVGAAMAGYMVEVELYRDGEKAIPGFLHGYAIFAAIAALLVWANRPTYRSLVGSRWWFLSGAFVAPILLAIILITPLLFER